ncbi:MAG: hypothetical protein MUF29_07895 [Chitinophagaceae bacterium]|jgi:hypothetical protein|nr:hypothetical protein [Chitinophagaceae bacterium]
MNYTLSLPTRYTWIGLAVFLPCAVLGALHLHLNVELSWLSLPGKAGDLFHGNRNFTDELALSGAIVGLLLMSFARTRQEDEFIQSLRLQSWHWAVLANFVLLLIAIWTVYDSHFLEFMVYNMLTVPVIFLLRFRYLLYKNRSAND